MHIDLFIVFSKLSTFIKSSNDLALHLLTNIILKKNYTLIWMNPDHSLDFFWHLHVYSFLYFSPFFFCHPKQMDREMSVMNFSCAFQL